MKKMIYNQPMMQVTYLFKFDVVRCSSGISTDTDKVEETEFGAPKRNAGVPAQHAAVSVDPTAAVPNGLEH